MQLILITCLSALVLGAGSMFVAKSNIKTHSSLRFRRSSFDGQATITKFHVLSRITTRYARALVTCVIRNDDDVPKEVGIEMRLPKAAFISNFSMEIEGQTYVGVVKEKSIAKAEYKQAVALGQSAGLVTANIRELQSFDVSVNVAAGGNVTFRLNYQELLKRKLGLYNHVIHADPGQIVDDFRIEVHISEPSGITSLDVNPEGTGKRRHKKVLDFDSVADVRVRRSETQAFISYEPTRKEQKHLAEFKVQYDVTRERVGGDLLIRNGYFVHFFAPSDLPVIPKKIVFVIDKSGSMSGLKIKQTREALLTILDDLGPNDQFNIITFSGGVHSWRVGEMVQVNDANIQRAKRFVVRIHAGGSTNFYEAAIQGVTLLETTTSGQSSNREQANMLVLLTDGQPTVGVTSTSDIRQRLRARIDGRYSVFCLGFGSDVDHSFLDKLSTENQGLSRRIYIDSDAALQLKGFYDEVASPMLAHVTFNYSGAPVVDVSETMFDNYFDGSEITVVGRIDESRLNDRSSVRDTSPPGFCGTVDGTSIDRNVNLVTLGRPIEPTFIDEGFNMEKIWAYLTVKQLLREKTLATEERKAEIDERVVALSLTHNFVTDMTSMVVTKPGGEPVLGGEAERPEIPPAPLPRVAWPRGGGYGRSYSGSSGGSYGGFYVGSSGGSYSQHSFLLPSGGYSSMLTHQNFVPTRGRKPRRRIFNRPTPKRMSIHRLLPGQAQHSDLSFSHSTTTTTPQTTTTPRPTTTPVTVPPPVNPLILQRNCGGDMEINVTTNITSPQHPGLYPRNSQCVWQFTKTSNRENPTKLKLTFENLDVEMGNSCNNDRVLIYPDFDVTHPEPEIRTFCGFNSSSSVVRARDQMLVVFQSDEVVQGRGFLINLQIEDVVA